jgi:RNA polymerase sigma-70 factor (ECF subfamily)
MNLAINSIHVNKRGTLAKTGSMSESLRQCSDEELMDRIADQNKEAFVEMVSRHSRGFYHTAYRFLVFKDDAQDITQSAFLKIWHRPRMWNKNKGAKFTTWFYRVVINLCIDHNKKRRPQLVDYDLDQSPAQNKGSMENTEFVQKQKKLEKMILTLPQRQQQALNLCFYEGLSQKEAAQIMGIRLKALESLLMRAKSRLQKENEK